MRIHWKSYQNWRGETFTVILPLFPTLQKFLLRISKSLLKFNYQIWIPLCNILHWSAMIKFESLNVTVPNNFQSIFDLFNLGIPQGFILLLYYFWPIAMFAGGWLPFVDITRLFFTDLLMLCNCFSVTLSKEKW